MSGYLITIATIIVINGIAACGLNVIVGFAGQISLGHAAFFGIGAYTAALLATQAGLSFWAALPLVIAVSALIVVGGLGSVPGAVVASLLLGMAETLLIGYANIPLPRDALAFIAMIGVLMWRSQGLLGSR